jgi:hypothetical protein
MVALVIRGKLMILTLILLLVTKYFALPRDRQTEPGAQCRELGYITIHDAMGHNRHTVCWCYIICTEVMLQE